VIARYRDFLPINGKTPIISLAEGDTPLIYSPQLSKRVGRGCDVFVKNEGVNPTCSFKDRGITVAVSKAVERGDFAIVNSINPDRIAGQKTAAFEIVDEMTDAPDFHLLPVGNAGNITSYWAGYREYYAHQKSTKCPAMIGFEAAGAAPIFYNRIIKKPETIASAIRIGNPASWKQAGAAIAESHGTIDIVSDEEILAAQTWLARHEGIFVEPASAAAIAGLFKCCDSNEAAYSFKKIPEESWIVCTVTGHGLKDPDVIMQRVREVKPVPATVNDVQRAIGL
jgi:threonine synthase